jgi:alanyl-tRNA synthetase
VNQAGSLVEPDRLRFDFSHFGSISPEELQDVELRVNRQIWTNTHVDISLKAIADAKAMGAMALFGEKYGDVVRVVKVGDYSLELCGGCHVQSTGQIGLFKITSESGIGSGIRRIEAVTGRGAYEYLDQQLQLLKDAAGHLKSGVQDVPRRLESTMQQMRELSRENESLRGKLNRIEAGALTDKVKHVAGIPVLASEVHASDMDSLRSIVDEMKGKLGSAVIVLAAAEDDKVNLVAAVTPDLVSKGFHAGKIIKEVAVIVGGSGGGRPDMAQAGGKDATKLQAALAAVEGLVVQQKA